MSLPPTDASIPVLTQVITSPPGTDTPGAAPQAVVPSAEQAKTDEQWKALELKLNERVLRQILRRVDFVIEHRVKENLASVIESATADMMQDIRRGLHETLEDVIKRAVAQEIARIQAIKD